MGVTSAKETCRRLGWRSSPWFICLTRNDDVRFCLPYEQLVSGRRCACEAWGSRRGAFTHPAALCSPKTPTPGSVPARNEATDCRYCLTSPPAELRIPVTSYTLRVVSYQQYHLWRIPHRLARFKYMHYHHHHHHLPYSTGHFSVYYVPGSTPVPQNPMDVMVKVMVKVRLSHDASRRSRSRLSFARIECYISHTLCTLVPLYVPSYSMSPRILCPFTPHPFPLVPSPSPLPPHPSPPIMKTCMMRFSRVACTPMFDQLAL